MRRFIMLFLSLSLFLIPVDALDLIAPEVPEFGQAYMPDDTSNLQEGLTQILQNALLKFRPDLKEAARVCLGIVAAKILA